MPKTYYLFGQRAKAFGMTTVYVAGIACENERDRKAYAEAARRLLKEAVKREYALDISAYVEKKSENGKP